MKAAELAARQELAAHRRAATAPRAGRRRSGSSGTARSIENILRENGSGRGRHHARWPGTIENNPAENRRSRPRSHRRPAAQPRAGAARRRRHHDRRCSTSWASSTMKVSDGALRHGVLYDLLGRVQHRDMREATVAQFMRRYHVDAPQAERVRAPGARRSTTRSRPAAIARTTPDRADARVGGAPGRDRPVDRARAVPQALGLRAVQRRHARVLAHGAGAPRAHRARAPRQARQGAGRRARRRRLERWCSRCAAPR